MPNFPYTFFNIADKAQSVLLNALSSAASSFTCRSGEGIRFPTADFCVKIEDETVYVSTRTTDSFNSVTRGYIGTSPSTHSSNVRFYQSADKALFSRIYDNLSLHTHPRADITDFSHTHPQGDITDLVSTLAALSAQISTKAAGTHVHTITSTTADGFAPIRPASNSTQFLRSDATWADVPAGVGGGGTPANYLSLLAGI